MDKPCRTNIQTEKLKASNRFWWDIKGLINCLVKKYTILKPYVILKKIKEKESVKASNIFIKNKSFPYKENETFTTEPQNTAFPSAPVVLIQGLKVLSYSLYEEKNPKN